MPDNDAIKNFFSIIITIVFSATLLLNSSLVSASHSFGGLDMCALYPEVMPPGVMPDQLPDAGGQGALLMQNYCTQCHELPGPGRHTAEEWPQVLDRMLVIMDVADRFGGLMGNVKTLSSDERDQLRGYLVSHALKPLLQTSPKAGLVAGSRAYERHCSACHALPDPAQYDVNWSDLLKRMQRNMQVMKYQPPSADSMMQIQLYLQNNKAVEASHVSADHLKLNMAGNSVSFDDRKDGLRDLNTGSWLSLGVFFILALIGFLRWWISHQHGNQHSQSQNEISDEA
jgi:cytochrome c5